MRVNVYRYPDSQEESEVGPCTTREIASDMDMSEEDRLQMEDELIRSGRYWLTGEHLLVRTIGPAKTTNQGELR